MQKGNQKGDKAGKEKEATVLLAVLYSTLLILGVHNAEAML